MNLDKHIINVLYTSLLHTYHYKTLDYSAI